MNFKFFSKKLHKCVQEEKYLLRIIKMELESAKMMWLKKNYIFELFYL